MSKSPFKQKVAKSAAAKARAKKAARGRGRGTARPNVPMDRVPVVPETRAPNADPSHVPLDHAALPHDVLEAVKAAASKKAEQLVVLDLRKAAGFTDFFVIATAANARQIRAIADAIEEVLAKRKIKPSHAEGYERTEWILLDYFDFVVHVFSAQTRAFYGLERLWGSAAPVDISSLLEPEPARPR